MRSGPRPLRVAAALLILLALGIDRGTWAVWSATGAVPGAPIHTGGIDLRVDGQDAVSGYAPLDLPRLVPGQTAATVLTVSNAGNVSLQWTASTSGTDPAKGLLAALRLTVTDASSPSGPTCGGTALAGTASSAGGPLVGTPRPLEPGGSEKVCVQVALPADAPNTVAATSTVLTIAAQGAIGGWTDSATVGGIGLATVPLTAPGVTCSGTVGLDLAMTWEEVPGATEYRVYDPLGGLLATIPAGDPLAATLVGLTGGTVRAYFGSDWLSDPAGC